MRASAGVNGWKGFSPAGFWARAEDQGFICFEKPREVEGGPGRSAESTSKSIKDHIEGVTWSEVERVICLKVLPN